MSLPVDDDVSDSVRMYARGDRRGEVAGSVQAVRSASLVYSAAIEASHAEYCDRLDRVQYSEVR